MRYFEPERLCGREINDKLELGRLLDRVLRAEINPRHLHPAAITFYVLSGAGVWQEEGKPPVTLKAGDSLFVPAGTIHSHWNSSTNQRLRFLEFIVAEKDKGRSIPQPLKD